MNIWDLYAPFYNASRKFEKKSYERMYQNIRTIIKDKNVLELATGTGIIAKNVAKSAKHIDATDFSEKMIEQANKDTAISNLTFSVLDACNLPYDDSSYDAVIISNALHIMPDPQQALSEIKRVLKPHGVLIAPTYVWGAMKCSQKLSSLLLKLFGFRVENSWNKAEYLAFLEQNGWQCTKVELLNGSYPLCYTECTAITGEQP